MNEIDQTITRIENELMLPNGFFDSLKNEDDWSFILKCHALIESACSFLLTEYFGNAAYEDIFSRLEMSDKKKGKIAFLQAAGIVVPEETRFISGLSEIRNRIIHNIRGVGFNFSEYVSKLDKNQKRKFAENFGYGYLSQSDNGKLVLKDSSIIFRNPKLAILGGVKLVLAVIKLQIETQDLKRESEEQKIEIYKLLSSLSSASK